MARPARRIRSLREYESLPYSDLGDRAVERLETATAALGVDVFHFGRRALRARHHVGVVRAGDVSVQILPKIFERDEDDLSFLVFLLQYTKRLKLRASAADLFSDVGGSFLEVWIRYFAEQLNRVLRHDPRRRYLSVEQRSSFVRGRLLVERDLDGRGSWSAQYPCRYQVFSEDHALYQLLKFCNYLLISEARARASRQLLYENEILLGAVSRRSFIASDVDAIHLTRLDRSYEGLLGLCRLLLDRSTLDLRSGRIAQMAFVFDMNRLFEEFVAEFLARHRAEIHLGPGRRLQSVKDQAFLGRLFGKFRMNVDLRLQDESGRTLLLDTKYKKLDRESSRYGLSQGDFYQMYAYGKAGSAEYPEIVLLYPTTDPYEAVFEAPGLTLYVSHFDPRRIYDAASRSLDVGGAIRELNRALSILP